MLTKHARRTVIYDRRIPRWIHLACLVPTIGLTGLMAWVVFFRQPSDDPFNRVEEIDATGQIIFGFFVLVGVFMTGVFVYRLFRNPPYFILYEDGFEYSPGGVSTGLIKWSDIVELRDETVLDGGASGQGRSPVTAVVLRNPGKYVERFPAVLRPLFAQRMQMNSSPILISQAEFGRDHDAILAIMRGQVAKARGSH
jgi:hypothetical protein